MKSFLPIFTLCALSFCQSFGASFFDRANQDETKVAPYTLPDVLSSPDSAIKVDCATDWNKFVRPQLREVFENEIYGAVAPRPQSLTFKLLEQGEAFGGLAVRKQIRITVADAKATRSFDMLLFLPKSDKPCPVFFGLNFNANHATCADPNIILADTFDRRTGKITKAAQKDRGFKPDPWPFEEILKRGYAVATIYYCQIYPDYPLPDAADKSVYSIFDSNVVDAGAIAAWAWGISRAVDCLSSMPEIDSRKIAVCGHSRLGKASLYAGAMDKRIALVVSNNSGCMGSALSRRKFGETVELMLYNFPHWLKKSAAKYSKNEENMPVDQHQLMALVAPRPLYITSASEDLWADPKGEFTSLVQASKVYALFGAKKLPTFDNFKPEEPFVGDVGYHMRKGKHAVVLYDWLRYIEFANSHFFPKD